MKKPISIRIDEKLLEKLKAKASIEKRSLTNLIEFVMERYADGKL